jgi:hypothetical protein
VSTTGNPRDQKHLKQLPQVWVFVDMGAGFCVSAGTDVGLDLDFKIQQK